MIVINLDPKYKNEFNYLALHPLQSWEWGEFRKKTGIEIIRLGRFEKGKLVETAQLTIHPIPFTSANIGYLPKGGTPSKQMFSKLIEVGKQYNCIFIKLEPNIKKDNFKFLPPKLDPASGGKISNFSRPSSIPQAAGKFQIFPSPHPLFTKYTFILDITKTENDLLKNMQSKTRYNIKIAQKHGVVVEENNSDNSFNTYLQLLEETAKRQKFYAHSKRYHQLMWETLRLRSGFTPRVHPEGQSPPIAHLITARYKGTLLVTWILFLFNKILYYPYGASSELFKNVMANNLIMWEAIRFGKKHGAEMFDMWGALGPNPNQLDPWYGFHRFKQGYGGKLVELAGSFDLVINPNLYNLYNLVHRARETFLKVKSYLN